MAVSRIFALCCALLLAGCWGHSYPRVSDFVRSVEQPASQAETVQVFVDANGTFYPSGWDRHMRRNRSWAADSLLNESNDQPAFRSLIESDERRQLAEIAEFGSGKRRIFVLVHGYNNTVSQAEGPFRSIEAKLDADREDGVIRFFWDGLTGSGIGSPKIWFNAAGYSQLAGSRGLRRVLNQFSGKDVYLIGHSRGASVILSALGDPVYDPEFLDQTRAVSSTWGPAYANFLSPAPLADRSNRLHLILMAPAVDRIDFCDASQQPAQLGPFKCTVLRDFGPQLQSVRYTVNSRDWVLNKLVGASGGFNPTGLGLRHEVGRDLQERYPFFQAYPFAEPQRFHRFPNYVRHPTFDRMLDDAGILKH